MNNKLVIITIYVMNGTDSQVLRSLILTLAETRRPLELGTGK